MSEFKKAIFIEATRDGYGPEQCSTMTVADLIDVLDELRDCYGDDCLVFTRHDRGYTYGGFRFGSVSAGCYDDHGVYDEDSDEFASVRGW